MLIMCTQMNACNPLHVGHAVLPHLNLFSDQGYCKINNSLPEFVCMWLLLGAEICSNKQRFLNGFEIAKFCVSLWAGVTFL